MTNLTRPTILTDAELKELAEVFSKISDFKQDADALKRVIERMKQTVHTCECWCEKDGPFTTMGATDGNGYKYSIELQRELGLEASGTLDILAPDGSFIYKSLNYSKSYQEIYYPISEVYTLIYNILPRKEREKLEPPTNKAKILIVLSALKATILKFKEKRK